MEIKARLKGTFQCKGIKHYAETNARMFNAVLHVRMSREQIESVFDKGLATLAFSGLATDEDGGVSWGYKDTTPDVNCSKHTLELTDAEKKPLSPTALGVVPEIVKIKPAEDEAKVIVSIVFPVEARNRQLCGALAMAVGDVVTAKLTPQQMDLFEEGKEPQTPQKRPGRHGTVIPMPAQ